MTNTILGPIHINGSLTVSGNVTAGAPLTTGRSIEGVTVAAERPYEQDGWISVTVKLMKGKQVYQNNPLAHNEHAERLVKLWLADNASGPFVVLMSTVAFKNEEDALMFYLRFADAPLSPKE